MPTSLFKTRVTELLGIEYPIIQGGMLWLSRAGLVAAVSNAGGLGVLTSSHFPTKEELRQEIRKTRDLTNKPFGVNINLFPTTRPVNTDEYIDVLIEEGVRIVETSGRSPEPYMARLKSAGVKVIHKVPGVRFARTAERVGVDAVAIVGFECGGHPGLEDVTSLVLIPLTTDAVKVPVIAGGGFADARGFVAARALGAEGVLMGTRFMLTRECWAHPRVKERLLEAKENETVILGRSIRDNARALLNEQAKKALELEAKGATLEELLPVISGLGEKKVYETGDLEAGVLHCGQIVGLINDVVSVKEVIDGIVQGALAIQKRLSA
ncbi:MAG: nitronate monooxygenase [Chloroflexi bacterium]|nr:nitronate monooxygenase [Chloroflexota bacterium]